MTNNNIRERITQSIIEALEKGPPPWQSGWAGNQLPFNASSTKQYRGINALALSLISAQRGYDDPRWMTLKQANFAGHGIRKGAKSAKIIRMVEVERKDAKADEPGEIIADGPNKMLVMRTYDVFNAKDIEGLEPLPARGVDVEPHEAVDRIVNGLKSTGLIVLYGGDQAYYSPKLDTVKMPDKDRFKKGDRTTISAVLLHECVHATGSDARLKRLDPDAKFGTPNYAREELVADLASAFLCGELSLPQSQDHLNNHAAYVKNWLEILRSDKNAIFRAASEAQRACDYLHELAIVPDPQWNQEQEATNPVQAMTPKPSRRPAPTMRAA